MMSDDTPLDWIAEYRNKVVDLIDDKSHMILQLADRDALLAKAEQNYELTSKILTLLGVDPSDWSSGLQGIYSAIRSNMEIGEPELMSKEDWTDGELNDDSITANMFKLVAKVTQAEGEVTRLREALKPFAEMEQDYMNVVGQCEPNESPFFWDWFERNGDYRLIGENIKQAWKALQAELTHEKGDSALFLQSLANRDQDVAQLQAERDALSQQLADALEANGALKDFVVKVMNVTRTGGEWNGYNGDNVLAGLSLEAEHIIKAQAASAGDGSDGETILVTSREAEIVSITTGDPHEVSFFELMVNGELSQEFIKAAQEDGLKVTVTVTAKPPA